MDDGRRRLLLTLLTGVSQAVAFASVGLLGVLIAAKFGASSRTDGFFIANSIYAIVLFLGQSLRTTTVGLFTRDPRSAADTFLSGAVMSLLAGAVFLAAAMFVAPAVLPDSGVATARGSLALLWPAASFQIMSGMLAAVLGTRDRVTTAAYAYTAGSVTAVALFVPLTHPFGIYAVPASLLIGTAVTTCAMAVALRRTGRLDLSGGDARRAWSRTGALLLGATGMIGGQLIVALSTTLVAHVGEQAASTYAYASMIIALLMATAVSPAGVVMAPVVARDWDGDREQLSDRSTALLRFGIVLVLPAVAAVALLGPAIGSALLPKLSDDMIHSIITTTLVLSPVVLAGLAVLVPELGMLTQGRFQTVAKVTVVTVSLHVVISLVAVSQGAGLTAIAAVATSMAVLSATLLTWIAAGPQLLGRFAVALLQLAVPIAAAFVITAALVSPGDDALKALAAYLLGVAGSACWLAFGRREESRAWIALLPLPKRRKSA